MKFSTVEEREELLKKTKENPGSPCTHAASKVWAIKFEAHIKAQ